MGGAFHHAVSQAEKRCLRFAKGAGKSVAWYHQVRHVRRLNMARKDRGHRETKRPKKDKAKKGLNKSSPAPLPTTEVRVRTKKVVPVEAET